MNLIKYFSIIAFLFVCSLSSFSQTTNTEKDKLSLNSGTIDSQFDFVIKRSNKYQDYKVVKRNWLYTLKAHTIDSLKAVHKDLSDTQEIVDRQASEISTLKSSLANTQTNLDKTNTEKDNMALFGMQMSKSSYNVLMWAIIAGLLALLILFIYKFKNSNTITKNAKHALSEIEEEFDGHRKTALEREQKVRRQLQDEINKHKG